MRFVAGYGFTHVTCIKVEDGRIMDKSSIRVEPRSDASSLDVLERDEVFLYHKLFYVSEKEQYYNVE